MDLIIPPHPISFEQACMMREAVRCDYVLGIKVGQSSESYDWFWEYVPVRDGSVAGIELSHVSGARIAQTLRAVLPYFTNEAPLLMRDLAVAASQHVELTLEDKDGARIISSVFSDLANLLCQTGKQGEAYLADVLAFLAVENIHPCFEHDTLRPGLMFPEEAPTLPNTHRIDLRVRAWENNKLQPAPTG